MNTVLIIPARFDSTRFPGKPLFNIAGKSMIQRTWEQCVQSFPKEKIFVATDDQRIETHCLEIGIQTIMTSTNCLTGTDRVWEASQQIDADIYVNVQGDEPLFNPDDITAVLQASQRDPHLVINAMCQINEESDYFNYHVPKVVASVDGKLLYMSRSAIPSNETNHFAFAMRQVCAYAFPKAALAGFASVSARTPLESQEDIEIIRFLELGYEVKMIEVSHDSIPVDRPADVERVIEVLEKKLGGSSAKQIKDIYRKKKNN